MSFIDVGDHVRIKRRLYDHHFLVVKILDEESAKIVHFNAKATCDPLMKLPASIIYFVNYIVIIFSLLKLGLLFAARVRKQRLYIDPIGENVQRLDYFPSQKVFSVEEILERAESNLGRCDYNMFSNNCECLINFLIIGKRVSNQFMRALKYTIVVFAIFFLLIAALMSALF